MKPKLRSLRLRPRLKLVVLVGLVVLLKRLRRRRSLTLDPRVPLLPMRHMPAELLSRVFDSLDFWDLVRSSHVCRYWRHLARNHTRFWGSIYIDSITESAALWAADRMEMVEEVDTRRFALEVEFPGEHRLVESVLLDLVCWSISRVRDLRLHLCSTYVVSIWEALRNTMPHLANFELRIELAPFAEFQELGWFPMPPNVFGGLRTELRKVWLHNVVLPILPADGYDSIAAFSDVEEVLFSCDLDIGALFPGHLFEFFPRMKRLTLEAGDIGFPQPPT